jgi:hypothetical protein
MTVNAAELLGPQHEVLSPGEAQYAALTYIDRGWAVTAGPGLDSGGNCSCHLKAKCTNAGKHAHAGWGNEKRRTLSYDEARIYWSPGNELWQTQPVDQVFIVPYLSGLVVADVDNETAWLGLAESERPETLTQMSGSRRGPHLIYKFEWDLDGDPPALRNGLKNNAGEIKFRGIIGAAPDVHKSGGRYEWVNWGHEVAPAPEWMTAKRDTSSWDQAIDPELLSGFWGDVMFQADKGDLVRVGRSKTRRPLVIFAAAAKMAKWVMCGRITEDEVVDLLLEAGHANKAVADYGEHDIERQIRNGIKAGMQ